MAELSSVTEERMAPGWQSLLEAEFGKPYMDELLTFLKKERQAGKLIAPPSPQVLRALGEIDLAAVRVVILGQDPYHGPGQANGMCFAVNEGQPMPPSLRNIFKELGEDLNCAGPFDVTLEPWARQGVLLLNTVLTVELGKPLSHRDKGWEIFTSQVVRYVNTHCPHVVFILWGGSAGKHRTAIDESKHLVLTSAHPSPLSAHRGFFGSKPFSKANAFLVAKGLQPIDWAPRTRA